MPVEKCFFTGIVCVLFCIQIGQLIRYTRRIVNFDECSFGLRFRTENEEADRRNRKESFLVQYLPHSILCLYVGIVITHTRLVIDRSVWLMPNLARLNRESDTFPVPVRA